MMRAVTFAVFTALAIAVLGAFLLLSRNATLLFEAKVERGQIVHFRGRAPKPLVRGFNDVLRVRPVSAAILRVCSSGDRAELVGKGDIDDRETQRLRNVLGLFPIAQIRSQPYRKW